MNEKRLGAWAQSSADPTEVSNRIKGLIIAGSGLIIFAAAKFFNVELTPEDIVELATQVSVLGGLLVTIYGAGLAFVRWVASKTA